MMVVKKSRLQARQLPQKQLLRVEDDVFAARTHDGLTDQTLLKEEPHVLLESGTNAEYNIIRKSCLLSSVLPRPLPLFCNLHAETFVLVWEYLFALWYTPTLDFPQKSTTSHGSSPSLIGLFTTVEQSIHCQFYAHIIGQYIYTCFISWLLYEGPRQVAIRLHLEIHPG